MTKSHKAKIIAVMHMKTGIHQMDFDLVTAHQHATTRPNKACLSGKYSRFVVSHITETNY